MKSIDKNNFWNLKNVPVFVNSKNGQMMIVLPKKLIKNYPKFVDLKIRRSK